MVVRYFLLISICFILFWSCADQKLSLTQSVISSSLKLDGFYYVKSKQPVNSIYREEDTYYIVFYYKNGVSFDIGTATKKEFGELDSFIRRKAIELRDEKTNWGLYQTNSNKIICEGWNTSIGGGLPKWRAEGYIPNDSTIIFNKNIVYDNKWFPKVKEGYESANHFYKFSPKPDSTNDFTR